MGKPKSIEFRELAIAHYKQKKTVLQIVELLNSKVSKRTIYSWINQFEKITHLKSTGRKVTVSTIAHSQKVKRQIKKNTGRFISRKLGIS